MQTSFRIFLVMFWLVLIGYTLVVTVNHGLILFAVFFGDMASMGWPGQFNVDFMGFLLLSAIWVLWRNQFRPSCYPLAFLAAVGGMSFLPIYLLYLGHQTDGDMGRILLGDERAAA